MKGCELHMHYKCFRGLLGPCFACFQHFLGLLTAGLSATFEVRYASAREK